MRRFLIAGIISLFPLQAHALSQEEGLLYSAIGCTSLYQKLDQGEEATQLLTFIHHYSTKHAIQEVQSGYVTRFIKLVERKWEKDNALARKNCAGILILAQQETPPLTHNALTQTVIDYLKDLAAQKKAP